MKLLLKIKLAAIFLLTGIISEAQDIQRFLGPYHLEGICETFIENNFVFTEERDVIITEGTESDLLINIGASAGNNEFKVFISEDSLFIPVQWWVNFNETQASFQGKGNIENDSLFLYYKATGSFGIIECNCKGKKTSQTSVLYPLPSNENKVYFDAANQLIVIDETLKGQSVTFELTDVQGKIVFRKTNVDNGFISIADLPSGVYLYRLLQGNQTTFSGKIIK